MAELQLRRGDSVRAIEIKFRRRWHLLGSLVGTRWRYPDQGKNKEFEALSEEAMPLFLAAPDMLVALEAIADNPQWALSIAHNAIDAAKKGTVKGVA